MPVACGVTTSTHLSVWPPQLTLDSGCLCLLPYADEVVFEGFVVWQICELLIFVVNAGFSSCTKTGFQKNNKTRSGSFTLGFRVSSLPHHCFRVHSVMGREKEEFLSHHPPLALQIHQGPETSPALENEVTFFLGTLFLVTNITYTRRGTCMDVYKRSGPSMSRK